MYGANYYAQGYYAQGPATILTNLLGLIRATTRFISGFNRYTKREI